MPSNKHSRQIFALVLVLLAVTQTYQVCSVGVDNCARCNVGNDCDAC